MWWPALEAIHLSGLSAKGFKNVAIFSLSLTDSPCVNATSSAEITVVPFNDVSAIKIWPVESIFICTCSLDKSMSGFPVCSDTFSRPTDISAENLKFDLNFLKSSSASVAELPFLTILSDALPMGNTESLIFSIRR